MTFETLAYIHRLLTIEEARTNEAYKKARDYLEELKEGHAANPIRKDAEETMENFDRIHINAYRALREFEEHEWR